MNLAVLIGVAKYTHPVSNLPACSNDVRMISELLKSTNKFGDILELSADTSSAEVKAQLAQFATKYKGQPVNELFFYYSGHGDLFKDDFYYLFSDFSDTRRNQTSLTNEELDAMLRMLSPKLTIKVVDACHAGITYVKEADALSKQLQTSKGRFSDCYFMFSSQSSQASLQDDKLSDFTEAFIEACTTFTGQDIRYRDIVDHISDSFAASTDQTPTFVIQAPCVEIFCTINDVIRKLLSGKGLSETKQKPAQSSVGAIIADAVREKAKQYCTKEEVLTFIQEFGTDLVGRGFIADLAGLYNLSVETSETYEGIGGLATVGKWVEENGADIFASPTYKAEAYEAQEIVSAGRPGMLLMQPEFKTVTRMRSVVSGFNCTAECPFKSLRITAKPNYNNLPHGVVGCVFVFSKKDFTLFYNIQLVKEVDWEMLSTVRSGKWSYISSLMKDDLDGSKLSSELINRFESFMTKAVRERLGLVEEVKPNTSGDGVGRGEPEGTKSK